MSAKSILYSPGYPLKEPPSCVPGRQEVTTSFRRDGRVYTVVLRDKIIPEDPYFMLVKAAAFAIRQGEPYMGRVIPRTVRDFLIKSSVVTG